MGCKRIALGIPKEGLIETITKYWIEKVPAIA